MRPYERRRVAAATAFTLVALPLAWFVDGGSDDSADRGADAQGAVVASTPSGSSTGSTTYSPQPPAFLETMGALGLPPSLVPVVASAPADNEARGIATFVGFGAVAGIDRPCTTLLAPVGALLTVTNTNTGQSTVCTNELLQSIPAGASTNLDTAVFASIASLADAPLPVRITW